MITPPPRLLPQLVFGQLVCLFFLSLHLRWKPYRDPSCDKLQFIVLVQLLVTYSFGLLYHSAPEDAANAESDAGGRPLSPHGPPLILPTPPAYTVRRAHHLSFASRPRVTRVARVAKSHGTSRRS